MYDNRIRQTSNTFYPTNRFAQWIAPLINKYFYNICFLDSKISFKTFILLDFKKLQFHIIQRGCPPPLAELSTKNIIFYVSPYFNSSEIRVREALQSKILYIIRSIKQYIYFTGFTLFLLNLCSLQSSIFMQFLK